MGLMMHNPRSFSFSLIDEQDLNFSVRLDPTQRKPNQSINQEHNLFTSWPAALHYTVC
jgi:hypothetical protein